MRKFLLVVIFLSVPLSVNSGFPGNIIKTAGGLLSGAGGFIGSPFGGFVAGLAGPSIEKMGDEGKKLINHANNAAEQRLNQIDEIINNGLDKADKLTTKQLNEVDRIIEKSIGDFGDVVVEVDNNMKESLAMLEQTLDNTVTGLDVLSTMKVPNIYTIWIARIVKLVFILLILVSAYQIYFKRTLSKRNKLILCLGTILLLGVSWVLPDWFVSGSQREYLQELKEYELGYHTALSSLNFTEALKKAMY